MLRSRAARFAVPVSLVLCLFALAIQTGGGNSGEPVEVVQLIDNGGFEEAAPADALGAFWLISAGRGNGLGIPTSLVSSERARTGSYALRIEAQAHSATQYVPALEELADRMTVSGSVFLASTSDGAASAKLTVRDSARREVVYVFSSRPRVPNNDASHAYVPVVVPADTWYDFDLAYGEDYLQAHGRNPLPRLTLELGKQDDGSAPITWDDLAAHVRFRQMSEPELLDAILNELRWTIDNLYEHTIDDINVPSPHLVKKIDAITGEVLSVGISGGGGPVYNHMLSVLEVEHDQTYLDRVVAMADEIVANLHPETRLPQKVNAETDLKIEGNVIPAPTINYLLRVHALTGDAAYLDAAAEIGEAVLRYAPRLRTSIRTPIAIPVDYIPNTYHSGTGDPIAPESTYVLHIRWFSAPGALVHLYSATGREDFRDAAVAAALSYADHDTTVHYWNVDYPLSPFSFEPTWYDWDKIDPAFDDYFGYGIGGRGGPHAILDIHALTGDDRLLPFLDDSLEAMGGVWEEGMYRGGYTFADDARSWQAYYDRYVVDPVKYANHKDLLIRNARNVFRSSQYSNGAWIDARFRLWNPSFPNDQASVPRNLLAALSWAYLVDDRNPEWRAMIASVFEKTVETYKREFGYLSSPDGATEGQNIGGIELRFLGELLNHLVPHLQAERLVDPSRALLGVHLGVLQGVDNLDGERDGLTVPQGHRQSIHSREQWPCVHPQRVAADLLAPLAA